MSRLQYAQLVRQLTSENPHPFTTTILKRSARTQKKTAAREQAAVKLLKTVRDKSIKGFEISR